MTQHADLASNAHWHPRGRTGRWESHIWYAKKQVHLGCFRTDTEAARYAGWLVNCTVLSALTLLNRRAYDMACIKFRGWDSGCLNYPAEVRLRVHCGCAFTWLQRITKPSASQEYRSSSALLHHVAHDDDAEFVQARCCRDWMRIHGPALKAWRCCATVLAPQHWRFALCD